MALDDGRRRKAAVDRDTDRRRAEPTGRVQPAQLFKIVSDLRPIELGLAEDAIFEDVRDLDGFAVRRFHGDLEADLESDRIELDALQSVALHEKKTARDIVNRRERIGKFAGDPRGEDSSFRPVFNAAAFDVAAPDRKAVTTARKCFDHLRNDRRIVAEIAVHRAERFGIGSGELPSVDHSARKPHLTRTVEAADGIASGEAIDDRAGSVGRIVVDDDQFAVEAARTKDVADPCDELLDPPRLIVRRDDDAEFHSGPWAGRCHDLIVYAANARLPCI